MTTIYLIRTNDDLQKFLQLNPAVTWNTGKPVSDSFQKGLPFPIALYINPGIGLTWDPIASGERNLRNAPNQYKLGTISPVLPYGKVFTTFLKHHNAYQEFVDQAFQYTKNIQFSELLIDTVDWGDSFEGYEYWDNLDDKWQALIDTLKLNRNEIIPDLLDILH